MNCGFSKKDYLDMLSSFNLILSPKDSRLQVSLITQILSSAQLGKSRNPGKKWEQDRLSLTLNYDLSPKSNLL